MCVCVCGGGYVHVAKNKGGIMSTYTKMGRGDFLSGREFVQLPNSAQSKQSSHLAYVQSET